jgi:hypothetical protein
VATEGLALSGEHRKAVVERALELIEAHDNAASLLWMTPIGATVDRTALAIAPRNPQPGSEPFQIHRRLRFAHPVQPTPIHPFPELCLGCADFGDQHDRIRDRLQSARLILVLVIDGGMR